MAFWVRTVFRFGISAIEAFVASRPSVPHNGYRARNEHITLTVLVYCACVAGAYKNRAPDRNLSPATLTLLEELVSPVAANMQKAKKYDWKDSNLALFGSDTEKSVRTSDFLYCSPRISLHVVLRVCLCVAAVYQVKKSSAETEPAWNGAGQNVGLQIWRIVKFKVREKTTTISQKLVQLQCQRIARGSLAKPQRMSNGRNDRSAHPTNARCEVNNICLSF